MTAPASDRTTRDFCMEACRCRTGIGSAIANPNPHRQNINIQRIRKLSTTRSRTPRSYVMQVVMQNNVVAEGPRPKSGTNP
jgi:hypothetical protein